MSNYFTNFKGLNRILVAAAVLILVRSTLAEQEPNYADMVRGRPIFPGAIVWAGDEPANGPDSRELWQALSAYDQGPKQGAEALEQFVIRHSASAWLPSLHSNLAEYYRRSGRYTLALDHWEAAWIATKDRPSFVCREIAARTLAHWSRLLGSLGRKDTLDALFSEAAARGLDATDYAAMNEGTKTGLAMMKARPGISFRCGSFALAQVAKALNTTNTITQRLQKLASPDGGFRLSELTELATKEGLNLVAANRGASSEIPVPCVLHWKLDHYAAVVERAESSYKVVDSTFGEAHWLDAETINAEASGNFMVPANNLPPTWKVLSVAEAALVRGKGYPNTPHDDLDEPPDDDDDDCNPPRSGDGSCVWEDPSGAGCEDPCGMPVFRISEPYISLWMHDVPLFYRTSMGWMKLKLSYNHRQAPGDKRFSSFGDRWGCNLLNYITTISGGTTATEAVAGGGIRRYEIIGGPEYKTGSRYATSGSGAATAPGVDYPSGTRKSYDYKLVLPSAITNWHIAYWRNPNYRIKNNYTYETVTNAFATNGLVRVTAITDIDGNAITFSYTNTASPDLITAVSDRFSRVARFFYHTNGWLTNITDMNGMSSSFQYDSTGFITNLHTPYGDTAFRYITAVTNVGGIGGSPLNRAIEITEPGGLKQLYTYRDDGYSLDSEPVSGTFQTGDSENFMNRNSYHWNRQQYAALSAQALTNYLDMPKEDYYKASLKHWLHIDPDWHELSGTLEAKAGPAADEAGHRGGISFQYQGQPNSAAAGSVQWITNVTRRIGGSHPYWQVAYLDITRNQWGRPTNITHSSPYAPTASFTNEYDLDGKRLLRQWGPRGEMIRGYGYLSSTSHVVISVTNALNEVTRYTHETNLFHVTSITYPSGLVQTNTYYSSGDYANWLQSSIVTNFSTNSYSYTNGNVYVHTNELRLATTNLWDNLNRLVQITYPDGTTISNRFDRLDLIGVKDRMSNWTYSGYDSLRQLIATTNANGAVRQYHYCSCGSSDQITNWVAGRALVTQLSYDLAGLVTNILYPDGYSVSYVYDIADRPTTATDSSGRQVTFSYSPFSKLKDIKIGNLWWLHRDFDEYARVTNSTDRNIVSTTNSYDLLGRVLNRRLIGPYATDQSGLEVFEYSSRGLTNYYDPLGKTNSYVRDAAGQVLFQTNANSEVLRFTYNPSGQISNLVDGEAHTTTWNYDEYGRVTNKVDANGTEMFRYKYDPAGRLTNRLQAGSITTTFRYDPVGNLTNVVYPTSSNIVLRYDDLNRLTNMSDGLGSTAFTWTDGNQMATEDGPWASDGVSYGYSGRQRSSLALSAPNASSWIQTYGYDEFFRLTNVTSPAGTFATQYKQPSDGSLNGASDLVYRRDLPGGSYIENDQDGLGRLLSTALRKADTTVLNSHDYVYNDGHQRTKQTFKAGNYQDYTYDNIGQLKTAKGKESGGSISRLHEQFGYAYDKAWNLTYRTNNALIQDFPMNNLNQVTDGGSSGTMTVAGTVWSNATSVTVNSSNAVRYADNTFASTNHTLAFGDNTFTAIANDAAGRTDTNISACYLLTSPECSYDSRGNLTTDSKRFFSYDDENQLTSVTVSNAWRSEFNYDGLHRRRTQKEYTWLGGAWVKTNEVRYVYDGLLAVQERDANNLPGTTYTRGNDLSGTFQRAGGIGGLLARSDNSMLTLGSWPLAHSYYAEDGNGNITALVSTNQIIVAKYQYDPSANLLSQSGPLAALNNYRFSSKEQHLNSGLYYFGFRFYDPNLQRWLNRDPIGISGGFNSYCFVQNAPGNFHDAFGLLPQCVKDWWKDTKQGFFDLGHELNGALGNILGTAGQYLGATKDTDEFGRISYEYNPLIMFGDAITLGDVSNYVGPKDMPIEQDGVKIPVSMHEDAHVPQSKEMGLFYLPGYLLGMMMSDWPRNPNWYEDHFMELGPNSCPPVPWP